MFKILSPEEMTALHREAFAVGEELHQQSPWDEKTFAALLARDTHFVLGAQEGFLLWQEVADEAEILTFAVAPAAQGQGVATNLLQSALHDMAARSITRVFLEVAETNTPARRLYARAQFVVYQKRKAYYRGQDALLMQRLM